MAARIIVLERLLAHVDGCIAKHQVHDKETERLQRWRRELLEEKYDLQRGVIWH